MVKISFVCHTWFTDLASSITELQPLNRNLCKFSPRKVGLEAILLLRVVVVVVVVVVQIFHHKIWHCCLLCTRLWISLVIQVDIIIVCRYLCLHLNSSMYSVWYFTRENTIQLIYWPCSGCISLAQLLITSHHIDQMYTYTTFDDIISHDVDQYVYIHNFWWHHITLINVCCISTE